MKEFLHTLSLSDCVPQSLLNCRFGGLQDLVSAISVLSLPPDAVTLCQGCPPRRKIARGIVHSLARKMDPETDAILTIRRHCRLEGGLVPTHGTHMSNGPKRVGRRQQGCLADENTLLD